MDERGFGMLSEFLRLVSGFYVMMRLYVGILSTCTIGGILWVFRFWGI